MKESVVPVAEFKARCLRLLDEVATQGRTLLITKRGKPIARVTPADAQVRPLWEDYKGRVRIKGDIVHFNVADEWEANKD